MNESSVGYAPEVRKRAVWMFFEHQKEHPSQRGARGMIAEKIGCTAETLRSQARQAERDPRVRPGLALEERERIKQLEHEDRELR